MSVAALIDAGRGAPEDAPDALVLRNLALVPAAARQMLGWFDEDVVGAGLIGLIYAARRYDPARGVRFSVYAWPWIRREILGHVRREAARGVHVTSSVGRTRRQNGRPTFFGQDVQVATVAGSLDDEAAEGRAFADLMPAPGPGPEGAALRDEATAELWTAVDALPPRHRAVILARFPPDGAAPLSLADIGRAIGRSRERARQLEAEALRMLRGRLDRTGICHHLPPIEARTRGRSARDAPETARSSRFRDRSTG